MITRTLPAFVHLGASQLRGPMATGCPANAVTATGDAVRGGQSHGEGAAGGLPALDALFTEYAAMQH